MEKAFSKANSSEIVTHTNHNSFKCYAALTRAQFQRLVRCFFLNYNVYQPVLNQGLFDYIDFNNRYDTKKKCVNLF